MLASQFETQLSQSDGGSSPLIARSFSMQKSGSHPHLRRFRDFPKTGSARAVPEPSGSSTREADAVSQAREVYRDFSDAIIVMCYRYLQCIDRSNPADG
jgi:hypothetical protein